MDASMLALATPRLAIRGLVGSLTLGLAACGNDTVSSPTSPTLLQPSPDLVVAATKSTPMWGRVDCGAHTVPLVHILRRSNPEGL